MDEADARHIAAEREIERVIANIITRIIRDLRIKPRLTQNIDKAHSIDARMAQARSVRINRAGRAADIFSVGDKLAAFIARAGFNADRGAFGGQTQMQNRIGFGLMDQRSHPRLGSIPNDRQNARGELDTLQRISRKTLHDLGGWIFRRAGEGAKSGQ